MIDIIHIVVLLVVSWISVVALIKKDYLVAIYFILVSIAVHLEHATNQILELLQK